MDFWLDTNVIIRFLANDHQVHSKAAKQIIMDAYEGKYRLWVHSVVLAECCYVLEGKYYGYDRITIADVLSAFLKTKGIKTDSPHLIHALDIYAHEKIDFVDALLSVASKSQQVPVLSFNTKDYLKTECEYYDPTKLVEGIDS